MGIRRRVSYSDQLSRTGELPFPVHGRMAGRSDRTAHRADSLGEDSALTHDFPAALLGHVRQRVHARHQQSRRTENPLREQQSRPPEHLWGGIETVQLAHRKTREQEGQAQILDNHRRAAHDLLQGPGQPDCHRPKQQGFHHAGLSGLLPAETRLRRQGSRRGDEHRRQHLFWTGGQNRQAPV